MDSSVPPNMRGMRQLKTGLWVARLRSLPATNSLLSSEKELEPLVVLGAAELSRILYEERRRVERQRASVRRSKRAMIAARKKLQKTIEKNRALTSLRFALQAESWDEEGQLPKEPGRPSRRQLVQEITY